MARQYVILSAVGQDQLGIVERITRGEWSSMWPMWRRKPHSPVGWGVLGLPLSLCYPPEKWDSLRRSVKALFQEALTVATMATSRAPREF